MKIIKHCALGPLLFSICSCIVPFPHRSHLTKEFRGVVVDSHSGVGIPAATVTLDYYGTGTDEVSAITATDGAFKFKETYIQHWAYLYGPINMSLPGGGSPMPPALASVGASPRCITITKKGYQTQKDKSPLSNALSDGYFLTYNLKPISNLSSRTRHPTE